MESGLRVQCMAIPADLWKSSEVCHSTAYGKAQLFFNLHVPSAYMSQLLDDLEDARPFLLK